MNDHQQNIIGLNEAFIAQILKAKARFIHICFAAIMPKEIYDLASQDNQLKRCEAWAKEQGYQWEEKIGGGTSELLLKKGPVICAQFRPVLEGERENRRCVFYAKVWGKPVNVTVDDRLFSPN